MNQWKFKFDTKAEKHVLLELKEGNKNDSFRYSYDSKRINRRRYF
jgi:hypothetical protein